MVRDGGLIGTLDIELARNANSIGRLTIEGTGSRAIASTDYGRYGSRYGGAGGFSEIGRYGRGYLTIRDGGQFLAANTDGETDAAFLRFGRVSGAYGFGLVSGEGSSLDIRQIGPAGDDYGVGAGLQLGDGGYGLLRVENDAAVAVTGDGAEIEIADGRGGYADGGRIEVLDGGSITVDDEGYSGARLVVAVAGTSSASMLVSGAGSRVTLRSNDITTNNYRTGELVIGDYGQGSLDVANSGSVRARELTVGVSGSYNSEDSAVTSSVTISDGGEIDIRSYAATPYQGISIADGAGTTGAVTVTGEGSRLTIAGAGGEAGRGAARLEVGRGGNGTLTIENGGSASAFFMGIGQEATAKGTVIIRGEGSVLRGIESAGTFREYSVGNGFGEETNGSAFLRLGRDDGGAEGRIEISEGGALVLESDPASGKVSPGIRAGQGIGSAGDIVVDGPGSAIRIVQATVPAAQEDKGGPFIELGGQSGDASRGGRGSLTVSNGAEVSLVGNKAEVTVGEGDPSTGPEDTMERTSRLTIESGSRVVLDATGEPTEALLRIGDNPGAHGAVIVTGAGSELILVDGFGEIRLAESGTGRLEIADGGQVVSGSLDQGQGGRLDLDGSITGDLTLGGTFEIAGRDVGTAMIDGDLTLEPGAILFLDARSTGADSITVTGDLILDLSAIEVRVDTRGLGDLGEDTIEYFDVAGMTMVMGETRAGTGSELVDLAVEDGQIVLRQGSALSIVQAQTVALLFEAAFNRGGMIDLEGLNFWIDAREGVLPDGAPPITEIELSRAFLDADEFQEAFGDPDALTGEEFVGVLYENILDREGEASGLEFWVNSLELGAVDRPDVLLAFAKSPENLAGSPEIETLTEVEPGLWGFV